MRYKHFKNANVDVSELAVGTWAIGESAVTGTLTVTTPLKRSRRRWTEASI